MIAEVNGIRIFYEKRGEGRPIVMVHGNGEDHTIFDKAAVSLSARYAVRRLGPEDVGSVFALCAGNPQYYRYSPAELSEAQILSDMALLPPRTLPSQKRYVGYYDADALAAVMDLIDGYPDPETAFIGFFMVERSLQMQGVGSGIIRELCAFLKREGTAAVVFVEEDRVRHPAGIHHPDQRPDHVRIALQLREPHTSRQIL